MSRGVWGAMAGLGQGLSQFAGFMYEDIKQQQLERFRSAEAQKDREWRSEETRLAREQDQKQFDQTFNAQQELRGKQIELLETNLREANINLDEMEDYKSARESYLANPNDQTRKKLEDTLFSMGKLKDSGFELIKLKTTDGVNETEIPYLFNSRTGALSPVLGGQSSESIPAEDLALMRSQLDDPEARADFQREYGIDPMSLFGQEEEGLLGKLWDVYWGSTQALSNSWDKAWTSGTRAIGNYLSSQPRTGPGEGIPNRRERTSAAQRMMQNQN